MGYNIELPDELFAKLQKHAVPLIDTPLDVIERAIRALEAGDEDPATASDLHAPRTFNPAAAPNLSFTNLRSAKVGGVNLPKNDTYWNSLMHAVILAAAAKGNSAQDIYDLISVNCVLGRREDNGFKFLESAGLSIQGQAANSAWKQSFVLASSFGIEVDVTFAWQSHDKAQLPNVTGSMYYAGE
jgi:hypothetical protein